MAAVAICILRALPGRRWGAAALLALLAVVAVEGLQAQLSRTASLRDVTVGAAGVLVGLVGVHVWSRGGHGLARLGHAALTAGLALALLAPVFALRHAERLRDRRLPLLADFEQASELRLWVPYDPQTWIEPTATPVARGRRALRVHAAAGSWTGVSFLAGDSDWTAWQALACDVYNPGDGFELGVRIEDRHGAAHGERFERRFPLVTGWNRVRLPLREVRSAPADRPLDLTGVRLLRFFIGRDQPAREFVLDHVRLEPQGQSEPM